MRFVILEAETPSDERSILAAFDPSFGGERLVPTESFLRTAYGILNRRFFGGKLPSDLEFKVVSRPGGHFVGMASYGWNFDPLSPGAYRIRPTKVTLNSSRTLTLHEWLEVVLHEMVHVLDYQTHPEHFQERARRVRRRAYDPHGGWFLGQGENYRKYGFNVQKYCDAEIGINTDDRKVKKALEGAVFILFRDNKQGRDVVSKVTRNTLEKHLGYIAGRFPDNKEIYVVSSDNPGVARLKTLKMRDGFSRIAYYFYNDDFVSKFGPFKTERVVSVKDNLSEEEENGGRLDPEEVKDEIYNSVENVANVKQTGEGEFEVSIP